jgi:2-isopropylmalate synthase
VGFPAASQAEFDFIRHLIEHHLIPANVTIQVLVPARSDLIYRTFAALQGAPRAIVHVYNATAPVFRQVVFGHDQAQTIALATTAAQLIFKLAAEHPETQWRFQYSPEVFTSTELDFARDICNAVLDIWQPTPEQPAIINLPASVEVATPNVFADQVEWMHRHLIPRDSVTLCVHTHNDRGCSVAAAELAQMAGAERVEGCLFGNGERTGNVDLVTLAMNLYTQGIHPGLDFSQIDAIAEVAQDCTGLPIHPRHPYAGELVFTAFSGSHQDAIKKGFAVQEQDQRWQVPYLPMDPADVGRTYESVVRVNSQSGKGGIAFLLERDYGVVLPRSLQVEFSQVVQKQMDVAGKELSSEDLWQLFTHQYLQGHPFKYRSHQMIETLSGWAITAELERGQQALTIQGEGNGPIDAFLDAFSSVLGHDLHIQHYEERALQQGSDAAAIAIIQLRISENADLHHGVGINANIVTASLLAILSALNQNAQTSPEWLDPRFSHASI